MFRGKNIYIYEKKVNFKNINVTCKFVEINKINLLIK